MQLGFSLKMKNQSEKLKKGYFGCGVVYIEPMNAKEDYCLLKVTNGCDH